MLSWKLGRAQLWSYFVLGVGLAEVFGTEGLHSLITCEIVEMEALAARHLKKVRKI